MSYLQPLSLEDAIAVMSDRTHRPLAGGTDLYPALGGNPLSGGIVDLSAIEVLREITNVSGHVRIGAGVTWSQLIATELPPAFDVLKQTGRQVGSVQIQNVATLAGNLCNASPAADGVPPLLTLDAEVELSSVRGRRVLPLGQFIEGNRRTALAPDELMTAILIPDSAIDGQSAFEKLGARSYLVISIAMAAARIVLDAQGRVRTARVAVGACSLVAMRLESLERALIGARADEMLGSRVEVGHLAELRPIDDVRATAAYRREAALELVRRVLNHCGEAHR